MKFVKSRQAPDIAINYINAQNNDGESALHKVCQITRDEVKVPESDKEIIKMLLENGGEVAIHTKGSQETCFHYCATAGNNEVLTEMLSHMTATDIQKAINKQSSIGWTPLLIACHKGHMEFVTTLLNNHARVDVFDTEGR
jgi:ankyrin repeat protein